MPCAPAAPSSQPYVPRSELMVPLIYDGSRIYQKLYNMVFDIVYMGSEAAYDGKKDLIYRNAWWCGVDLVASDI